jgi:hypothetical protein
MSAQESPTCIILFLANNKRLPIKNPQHFTIRLEDISHAANSILDQLADSKNILVAGAGGFDVFAGLPLYFALRG